MSTYIIVGAGPVGAVCALAMRLRGVTGDIQLLDAAKPGQPAIQGRTLALSYGARLLLDRVGVWGLLAGAHPIEAIEVTQQGGFGLTRIRACEMKLPALGYTVDYADLHAALARALVRVGLRPRFNAKVASLQTDPAHAHVRLADGEALRADTAILADGGAAALPGMKAWTHDPKQHALTCTVRASRPVPGRALERFTINGPAALLPVNGSDYALVWTHASDRVDARMNQDPAQFDHDLQALFGESMGRLHRLTTPKVHSLGLRVTEPRIQGRLVCIGNAAQTLHPIAGQGLNLGLRDAWELAGCLAEGAALWRYAAGRALDRVGGVAMTEGLLRIFQLPAVVASAPRGLALALVDTFPGLKPWLARRMIYGFS